ncbi:MAG TPA: DUF3667 domain-containing protein [Sphingomicrobium sp.]|nr:DUF3667 domain-containing protein [Sphingomicrobium sp.]
MATTDSSAAPREGHTQERACLNCGCSLRGDYCHCCGQKAHVHRTLGAFWHDLLHGVLHFEGKTWRTLAMLVLRPGTLTRRYVDGERARFVSPLAMFLFTAFVMFTVVNVATPLGAPGFSVSESIERGIADERQRLRQLEARRATAGGQQARELDKQIAERRDDLADLEQLRRQGGSTAKAASDPLRGGKWFNRAFNKAQENPELLVYKLKTNAYKFSWALIPISVPFLWLLFPFSRRFGLYDHAVFVTYSLSFMTLLVVVGVLLMAAGMGTLASLAWLVPPFHMYAQLRGAYGLSRPGALWRTVLLVIFANVVVGLFASLLIWLGALG